MAQKEQRQLDVYHRAFKELRKETEQSAKSKRNRTSIHKNNIQKEHLETVRYECTVETDWIDRIERSLSSLESAVLEDRQFIRQEGNTVPIEKAKHVSRASVEHLAKHSNLITHVPEEGDKLIPDKLYVVENLSNYAIYENRFLYMLLVYIKNFVTLRYEAIEALWNSYHSEFSMAKDVHFRHRHLTFTVQLSEDSHNSEDTAYDCEVRHQLGRMTAILHMVSILLNTPLMQEVSKAPMLKPPITRTNMLRMDIHFKAAVDLFDYLNAYTAKGYEVRKIQNTLSPLPDEAGDEFAELVLLCSYLTYEYGGDLKAALEAEYEKEEERRREAAEAKKLAEIRALQERVRESGESPEVYMLALEKRNALLEQDRKDLKKLRVQHEELQEAYRTLQADLTLANARLESTQQMLDEANGRMQHLESQQESAKADFENRIADLNLRLSEATEALARETARADEAAAASNDGDILATDPAVQTAAEGAEDAVLTGIETDGGTVEIITEEEILTFTVPEEEEEKTEGEYKKLYFATKALYNGLRQKHGLIPLTEDYSSPEGIQELETELRYFMAFFDEEWDKAKKDIRRQYLWSKKIKKAKDEDGQTSKKKDEKKSDKKDEKKSEKKDEKKSEKKDEQKSEKKDEKKSEKKDEKKSEKKDEKKDSAPAEAPASPESTAADGDSPVPPAPEA